MTPTRQFELDILHGGSRGDEVTMATVGVQRADWHFGAKNFSFDGGGLSPRAYLALPNTSCSARAVASINASIRFSSTPTPSYPVPSTAWRSRV